MFRKASKLAVTKARSNPRGNGEITHDWLLKQHRRELSANGMDPEKVPLFKLHSPRIIDATTMLASGKISDMHMKAKGRWSGDIAYVYARFCPDMDRDAVRAMGCTDATPVMESIDLHWATVAAGCLRAGCAICFTLLTFRRNSKEFRLQRNSVSPSSSKSHTPVTNKRTTNAREKGQLRHATPPSWRGCTAVSLPVSLFLPACCADTCLTADLFRRWRGLATGTVPEFTEREFPFFLIPPPKNNSNARQLNPRGTRQNPGVAPQNPVFFAKKRVLR